MSSKRLAKEDDDRHSVLKSIVEQAQGERIPQQVQQQRSRLYRTANGPPEF
jgi:hypothetical protein